MESFCQIGAEIPPPGNAGPGRLALEIEVKMFNPDNATPVFVAASIIFIVAVWAIPVLLWLVVAPPLHSDSIARAAIVVTLLVVATAAATITMRS